MKFAKPEQQAKFKSLEALIDMFRKMEREQSSDLDSAKEIQEDEKELLDGAEGDPDGFEEEGEESSELEAEMGGAEDDEFEKEKKDFMSRDNKIGKPTPGRSKMILMLQGAMAPKGQPKGFKGTKGF